MVSVRGLGTLCGHGGHPQHAWFRRHVSCPTGCGCRCVVAFDAYQPDGGEDG